MDRIRADIVIVGGGSAGFGAAVRAARLSGGRLDIVLVEKEGLLGGTSTLAGVNCWEPGIAGPGIHKEVYKRLKARPLAVGIGKTTHFPTAEERWSVSVIDVNSSYEDTLQRAGLAAYEQRRVQFEPTAMCEVMDQILNEVGVRIMYNSTFVDLKISGNRIESIVVFNAHRGLFQIEADCFIDSTADIVVAGLAGARTVIGEEASSVYGEPSAPETSSANVNGVSQIFRVEPSSNRKVDELPSWVEEDFDAEWIEKVLEGGNVVSCMNVYPNGDININMLPTMEGHEFFAIPHDLAVKICRARALRYWNFLQRKKGFDRYRFRCFFPLVGIRESRRLVGGYVLNENDILAGFLKQDKRDELIAFADHALDIHSRTASKGGGIRELNMPYGVPYSCLLTREYENLLVACRGASFSHIAASSCRLERTMIALGEAAGAAAYISIRDNKGFWQINREELRRILKIPEFEEKLVKNMRAS